MTGANNMGTQSGMALLICLIFLTTLTLLGLSAYGDTVLQNQLVANFQDAERARQSALAALSWSEDWLLELEGPVPDYCRKPCDGLYVHRQGELPDHPESENHSWWQDHGYEVGMDPLAGVPSADVAANSNDNAVWIIEELHSIPPSTDGPKNLQVWYRILARGGDRNRTAVSVVESTVVRSWMSTGSQAPPAPENSGKCPGSHPEAECGRVSFRELR